MKHQPHRTGYGKRRKRVREQFWRDTFQQFPDSGQSVRGFCKSHGLSEASFYYWRQTLVTRDAVAGSGDHPTSTAPAFLPVRISGGNTGRMEIVLGGGRRIRLRGPVDQTALAEVVNVLESVQPGSVSC
jgi:transposase-like protein